MESVALASLAAVMLVEYPVEIPRLWYLIIAIVVMFLLKKEERSDAVHDAKLA
jgi:chromate transport protein ChrA